jgi:hypothetical protein
MVDAIEGVIMLLMLLVCVIGVVRAVSRVLDGVQRLMQGRLRGTVHAADQVVGMRLLVLVMVCILHHLVILTQAAASSSSSSSSLFHRHANTQAKVVLPVTHIHVKQLTRNS